MKMSVYDESKVTSKSAEVPEDTLSEAYIQHQSEFYYNLKQFLQSQQESLRTNLETARKKTEKSVPSPSSNDVGTTGKDEPGIEGDLLSHGSKVEATALKQKDEIQICPICGMEFDAGSGNDALEIHVTEHWGSSSSDFNVNQN